MSEEKPGLHIDLDWKKQAQEEKRRLEEEEKRRAEERAAAASAQSAPTAPVAAAPPPIGAPATTHGARGQARGARAGRELPPAGVQSLAQSLVTQALYYLGDMGARGGDEMTNMDMAKHLIDTLDVLENKTKGNLTPEEQQFLDTALYEARMRFIAVSGQVIAGA
jgi:hypothetical protein